jgi:HD-GYP domain-containing protein (c-di-GMP phosphodiesterase class II)
MTIRMDKLIKAIATALEIIERELLGVTTNHGKRVASLCAAMGRSLGMGRDELLSLTSCALLHDNALTEYIYAERLSQNHDPMMKLHCEYGQRNVEALLFPTDISGFILYHHERADGKGPYRKREGEIPLGAELIGIADSLDAYYHLEQLQEEQLPGVLAFIHKRIGTHYTARSAGALLHILDTSLFMALHDASINETADQAIPPWHIPIGEQALMNLVELSSRIIDYKSLFTRRHSTQIAHKTWLMGGYYGLGPVDRAELYLAAALHDLGKLATPVNILEKPGPLDQEEFHIIQHHAELTHTLLKDIDGFERICLWASSHHEKLDGSGYPWGKKAEELDFNSRLLGCIDIYQAVSEERPYHPGRKHREAAGILYAMADKGLIDRAIVKDADQVFAGYDGLDAPAPEQLSAAPNPGGRRPLATT